MNAPIRHLTLDLSDGSDEILTVEAMASTRDTQHGAVMTEVDLLRAWARREFAGRQGPVEDGHDWDDELLVQREADGWVTVTLTFSASPAFAQAFMAAFGDTED
ncbi:hypothetical protein [Roseateles amylovorans]|jgi:hypothetical protein|uniref:DUF3630 family protein n=1 Tax=Roseateles amylovorans TaxID=2978473 RepID=A0ABY6AYI2_9BURK|nr:hypothetical protein [Roseateles amylovorans]UXH78241.1 hypothetical protein N4261_25380 [Roseateles amylovorans]